MFKSGLTCRIGNFHHCALIIISPVLISDAQVQDANIEYKCFLIKSSQWRKQFH